jgi:hypothetical protein
VRPSPRADGCFRFAVMLPADPPKHCLWRLDLVNSLFLWTHGGRDPLTIRVDLHSSTGIAGATT